MRWPGELPAIAGGRQPPDLTVIALNRRLDQLLLSSSQERAVEEGEVGNDMGSKI
jgi:hypothetical protein